jgi:hypothetical protein
MVCNDFVRLYQTQTVDGDTCYAKNADQLRDAVEVRSAQRCVYSTPYTPT